MSAKSGKAFFMACGQRHAALLGRVPSPVNARSGQWPLWAKQAYFIGFTGQAVFKRVRP